MPTVPGFFPTTVALLFGGLVPLPAHFMPFLFSLHDEGHEASPVLHTLAGIFSSLPSFSQNLIRWPWHYPPPCGLMLFHNLLCSFGKYLLNSCRVAGSVNTSYEPRKNSEELHSCSHLPLFSAICLRCSCDTMLYYSYLLGCESENSLRTQAPSH